MKAHIPDIHVLKKNCSKNDVKILSK